MHRRVGEEACQYSGAVPRYQTEVRGVLVLGILPESISRFCEYEYGRTEGPSPPPPGGGTSRLRWGGGVQGSEEITRTLSCCNSDVQAVYQGWNQQDCSGVIVGGPLRLDP